MASTRRGSLVLAQANEVALLVSALQRMGGTVKFGEVFADEELELADLVAAWGGRETARQLGRENEDGACQPSAG